MLETQLGVLAKRGINSYQACIIAAREARSLNEKVLLGITEAGRKSTTIALEKLLDGRIIVSQDEGVES
jgi:DNA-directed RNA polymerase subunit K/omega